MVETSLFRSVRAEDAIRKEFSWEDMCERLAEPEDAAVPKEMLWCWSPAVFRGDVRKGAHVERVSLLVFDVDIDPVPPSLEEMGKAVESAFGSEGVKWFAHSSSSATKEQTRWRLLVNLSRPLTAEEFPIAWHALAKKLPFSVGPQSKDVGRIWFGPRQGEDGSFVAGGASDTARPLDVDALLELGGVQRGGAANEQLGGGQRGGVANDLTPAAPAPAASAPTPAHPAPDAAIAELVAAWPALGHGRHQAQMALAGALVRYWPDAEAHAFLCAVCRGAGDENPAKRLIAVREARAHLLEGTPFTGWPKLGEMLGADVVSKVRSILRMPEFVDGSVLSGAFDPKAPAAPTPRGPMFTFGGWSTAPPPTEYVVEGILTKGSVNMFVAHGDSMKTWALLSVLSAVADGKPWLGRYPVKAGRVGILDYENGRHEVHRRLRILQTDGTELGYSFGDISLTDAKLWKVIAEANLVMLGIDSLAAGSWGVDENSTSAHVPLLFAKELGEKVGTTTVFIHHARKGDSKADRRQEVRGASALFAACDAVYSFSNEAGEGKARVFATKTRQGKKPPPVNLELTDAHGITWYEDEAEEAKKMAYNAHPGMDADSALALEIKACIQRTPERSVSGAKELRSKLGKNYNDVVRVVGVLKERGDLVQRGDRRLYTDSKEEREARILATVTVQRDIRAQGSVAKIADVRISDVEALVKGGKIAKYAQGYGPVEPEDDDT